MNEPFFKKSDNAWHYLNAQGKQERLGLTKPEAWAR
jgi:hypothetical protein